MDSQILYDDYLAVFLPACENPQARILPGEGLGFNRLQDRDQTLGVNDVGFQEIEHRLCPGELQPTALHLESARESWLGSFGQLLQPIPG
ncbi:unnamed protein product [Nyctereutes procyonoides]|uniref:(raccoon dog) hypothetical protein n=1 Tax=Nyctereutes procyonoides TaxID=34880 RepID=A0A811Y334_NYCPR|nr:unnamed protein product [Nyctereutes procyonoides]